MFASSKMIIDSQNFYFQMKLCDFSIGFFPGPPHFRFFGDFCMRRTAPGANYAYTVCPYHNVTQLNLQVGDATDVVVG